MEIIVITPEIVRDEWSEYWDSIDHSVAYEKWGYFASIGYDIIKDPGLSKWLPTLSQNKLCKIYKEIQSWK